MAKIKKFFRRLKKLKIFHFFTVLAAILLINHHAIKFFSPLKEIKIIGNNHIKTDELNLPKLQTNILRISLTSIYEQIISRNWTKSLAVKRIFPDKIAIEIKEYIPFAVWNKKFLINEKGKIITKEFNRKQLLSITGENANLAAYGFVTDLKLTTMLNEIKELKYINKRRWDVIFTEGLTVKLPEENSKEAWNKALKIIDRNNLLENKIWVLDMRITDKFFIK
ncbi:MAG: FtsQ-type POTRA domain-containing protein [Rickettsiaceae bacterium H1]|nr:FtsQ-type POTRA domain-containing protein [Rickettsiaceae bacterium H1]